VDVRVVTVEGAVLIAQDPTAEDSTVRVGLTWSWASTLWVPEIKRTSCDLLIFVQQSAEAVAPMDVVGPGSRWVG